MGMCGQDCEKCVLYPYCGGCSLCEATLCKKDCFACSSLCPNRKGSESYIYFNSDEIGGPKIELIANSKIEMTDHIPILPDRFSEKPKFEHMELIGIHAGSMFARNGENINPGYLENGFAEALNLDPRTEGILQFYVKDRTLEGFWDNRKDNYEDLKKMHLKAIIAPNFSVYEDAPRMDHLYAIKRSSIVYNEMIEAGLNAVPDVSWYNIHDLNQWIREINEKSIKTIAFSFQVVDVKLKASSIWKHYLLGFRYLCQNIQPGVQIIIAGVTSPRRIVKIFQAAAKHKLIILNQTAFVQSRRGMQSEGRKQNTVLSKDELFEKNIIYFNQEYRKLNQLFSSKGGESNAEIKI